MRIIKKSKSRASARRSTSGTKHIGSNTLSNGPVCKPIRPGRVIKPLEGPVHPGFKGKKKVKKKKVAPSFTLKRSSQNNDLYKPLRKVSPKKVKRKRKVF